MADHFVLAIVAHPDDESLFMGGTLKKHATFGRKVHVVALSDGVGSRQNPDGHAMWRRQEHFRAACKALGATGELWSVFPDQRSDNVPQLEINKAVERIIEQHPWPTDVYTHHVGDLNLDHRKVAEAVLVATRGVCTVRSMAPEWPSRCVGPAWNPDVNVDLGPSLMEYKIRACNCYVDEMRPYPHPRSEQYIREHPVEYFMEIR